MSNLAINNHDKNVCMAFLEQIQACSKQINQEGLNTAYIDLFEKAITITVDQPNHKTIINEYALYDAIDMQRAANDIQQYVTVSPIGSSSDKDVAPIGETV